MSSIETRFAPSSSTSRRASVGRDLEDGEAADVGKDAVAENGRELVELGEALGGEDEAGPELPQLGQHRIVIHAGHGLHLVDDDEDAAAFLRWELSLLSNHGVDEVEHRRPDEGGDIATGDALRGGDEEDAAVPDGLPDIDGGSALAEDGAGPFGGCVVGEARLDGGGGVGLVLAVPSGEVALPPPPDEGVIDISENRLPKGAFVGREKAERVEDGVLALGLPLPVGLVEGLDDVFEDGLHARPPLIPEAVCDADDGVGGAVAVGEDARVEEVDAGRAVGVGEVDEADGLDEVLTGTCSRRDATRSAWGSMTTMASSSRPSAFCSILWATMCCMRVDLPMRVRAT